MLGFPRCARGGNVKCTWSSRTDSKFRIQIWRETAPDVTDRTRIRFSLVLSLEYPFSRTQNLFRRFLNPSGYWRSVYVETTTFAKLGELERLAFGRAQFVFSQRNTTSLLPPPTALQRPSPRAFSPPSWNTTMRQPCYPQGHHSPAYRPFNSSPTAPIDTCQQATEQRVLSPSPPLNELPERWFWL